MYAMEVLCHPIDNQIRITRVDLRQLPGSRNSGYGFVDTPILIRVDSGLS